MPAYIKTDFFRNETSIFSIGRISAFLATDVLAIRALTAVLVVVVMVFGTLPEQCSRTNVQRNRYFLHGLMYSYRSDSEWKKKIITLSRSFSVFYECSVRGVLVMTYITRSVRIIMHMCNSQRYLAVPSPRVWPPSIFPLDFAYSFLYTKYPPSNDPPPPPTSRTNLLFSCNGFKYGIHRRRIKIVIRTSSNNIFGIL